MTTRTAPSITDSTGRFIAEREERGLWNVRSVTKLYGEKYTTRAAAVAALAAMAARNPIETRGAMMLRIKRSIDAARILDGSKLAG